MHHYNFRAAFLTSPTLRTERRNISLGIECIFMRIIYARTQIKIYNNNSQDFTISIGATNDGQGRLLNILFVSFFCAMRALR